MLEDKNKHGLWREVFVLLAVFIAFVVFDAYKPLEYVERKSLDIRFKIRGAKEPNPTLTMVDIADDAVDQFGRWPFGRQYHAMLIDAAKYYGASQVVFDIYFSRPTKGMADRALGHITKEAGNVYYAIKFMTDRNVESNGEYKAMLQVQPYALPRLYPGLDEGVFRAKALLDPPLAQIGKNAAGMGFVNTWHDPDGKSRRTPLVLEYRQRLFLNLGLKALVDKWNVKPDDIRFYPGEELELKNALVKGEIKDVRIPLDENGNMLINWAGGWKDIPHLSYRDIIISYKMEREGQKPLLTSDQIMRIKGKTLIVGLTERGSHDYYPTPFDKAYFLSGLQFNLLHTIMNEDFIVRQNRMERILTLFALILFIWFVMNVLPVYFRFLAFPLVSLIFIGLAQYYFSHHNLWIDVSLPMMALITASVAILFLRLLSALEKNLNMKTTFGKYVSKDVMDQLLHHPEQMNLKGERKQVSILFADIRGFTRLASHAATEKVVTLLNEYLGAMTEIIFKHDGTIDKFVGDEVMAYFGAPLNPKDHAKRAVQAGIEMLSKMEELQEKWRKENSIVLQIGVGVDSGTVVVGNVGSDQYMDYTLIGDHVNQASRLCSHARPGEFLISQNTLDQTKDQVEVFADRRIRVKGKRRKLQVYSVVNFIAEEDRDRRRFIRHDLSILVQVKHVGGAISFSTMSKDVSAGGFNFEENVASLDTEMNLSLDFQLYDQEKLEGIEGRVVAIEELASGKKLTRVQFTRIKDVHQHRLVRFMHYQAKYGTAEEK